MFHRIKRYLSSYSTKKITAGLSKEDKEKLVTFENYGMLNKLIFIAIIFVILETFYLVSDLITKYYATHGYLHLYAILTILIPSLVLLIYFLTVKEKDNHNVQLITFIYYSFVIAGMLIFLASDIKTNDQYNVCYYYIIMISLCPIFDARLRYPIYLSILAGSIIVITLCTPNLTYASYEMPLILIGAYIISTSFFRLTSLRSYVQRIKLEQLSHEYEKISKKDFLTGLYNRTALDEFKNTKIKEAIDNGWTISVTMADIDDFKLYNDYYSHLSGD